MTCASKSWWVGTAASTVIAPLFEHASFTARGAIIGLADGGGVGVGEGVVLTCSGPGFTEFFVPGLASPLACFFGVVALLFDEPEKPEPLHAVVCEIRAPRMRMPKTCMFYSSGCWM